MADLSAHLSKDIIIRQVGVLDAYTVDQVHDEFAPLDDEPTMVSRLRNGEMCSFSKAKVMPLVQMTIDRECGNGADAIVILCTNRFDPLSCRVPLIVPYTLIHSMTQALGAGLRLGALFPFETHAESMKENWKETGFHVAYQCRISSDSSPIDESVAFFQESGCQLLVMDCIGYDFALYEQYLEKLQIPIIHPRSLLAETLHYLLHVTF